LYAEQSVYPIGNARVNPCVIATPDSHGVSIWQDLVIKKTARYSAHSCALSGLFQKYWRWNVLLPSDDSKSKLSSRQECLLYF